MSDERPHGSAGWRERLRKARNEDLIDVRYCARGEDVYFLVVHRDGARREALERFLDALRGDDMPPFAVRLEVAGREWTRWTDAPEYVSV